METAQVGIRTASPAERRRMVFELYGLLERPEIKQRLGDRVGYSVVHQAMAALTRHIRATYGVELGYRFDARNLFGPWDRVLQEDLEVLDAAGRVDNHDEFTERVTLHRLSPTEMGKSSAKIVAGARGKDYLFGRSRDSILKDLAENLQKAEAP